MPARKLKWIVESDGDGGVEFHSIPHYDDEYGDYYNTKAEAKREFIKDMAHAINDSMSRIQRFTQRMASAKELAV